MSTRHRHGAAVVDVSAAVLYASLPQGEKVAVTMPAGFGIKGQAMAPSPLWAGHPGAHTKSHGFRRSKLDPAVLLKGAGEALLTCLVHVGDMVIGGQNQLVKNHNTTMKKAFELKHGHDFEVDGNHAPLLGRDRRIKNGGQDRSKLRARLCRVSLLRYPPIGGAQRRSIQRSIRREAGRKKAHPTRWWSGLLRLGAQVAKRLGSAVAL